MNFEINVYFAKFLASPRYLEYIKYILKTERREGDLIDVRFYVMRSKWFDMESQTYESAIDKIKLFIAKLSVGIKPEVRQDIIDEYLFVGRC